MASSYEIKIEKILRENRIKYKKEVIFSDLHGARTAPLRFDFGIYNNIGNLLMLIEVDGEYHFKPIRGKLAFWRQQAYDEKKNVYCLAHHIKLIRIPYWEMEFMTWEKIINTPYFVVKGKYHNNKLKPPT